jgi:DNA-binding XRE family transcriptional regulator
MAGRGLMHQANELIKRRERAGISQVGFADLLQIDRTTLWKRERNPDKAPAGFWDTYEERLNAAIAAKQAELACVGSAA